MKSQKKRKKDLLSNSSDASVVSVVSEMPTADLVAAERASEAAYERELTALMLGEGSDSGGSDGEVRLLNALRPLQLLQPPAIARPPPAMRLLSLLAAGLHDVHSHDTRFFDEYKFLLDESTEAEGQAVSEELIRSVEGTLSAGRAGGAGGGAGCGAGTMSLVVWLSAATAWRSASVPRLLPTLHGLLQQLPQREVMEVARGLHSVMGPRELIVVSDAVRGVSGDGGASGRTLSALLLRAALARLLGVEPDWQAGALDAKELHALAERWSRLDVEAQLAGLALVGRVLAGGPREEAGALLAALAPPPPKDMQDPDYLKVSVAVKTLQNLFKDM